MNAGQQDATALPAHVHDPFRCAAHMEGCGCPDPGNSMCNPYHAAGHCPDDIEVMPRQ